MVTEESDNRAKRETDKPEHRPEREPTFASASKKRKADNPSEKHSHKRRISLNDIKRVVEDVSR